MSNTKTVGTRGAKLTAAVVALLLALILLLAPTAEPAGAGTQRHLAPLVSADQSAVTVYKGQTATNTGTYSDTQDRDSDRVRISASVGKVTKTGKDSGTWSWSLDTTDVSAGQTQQVTITAKDSTGLRTKTTFSLTVKKPFGPGNWPPATWRPYADSSPFNKPLPADPKIAASSSRIVDRIIDNVPYGTSNGGIARDNRPNHLVVHKDGSSGEPTYYSRPTDPLFTLHCTYTRWGVCPLEGRQVRIPVGAQTEGNQAAANTNSTGEYWTQPDAHMTIVDQDTNTEFDLWQVHTNPIPAGGGDLYFSWGGLTDFDGNGLASDELKKDSSGNPVPNAVVGDATAARFGSLAGRVRAEEFAAGEINHALFIGVDCDSNSYVYPARKSGRPCSQVTLPDGSKLSNTDAPPMGTRLQLNMTASEIDALPVPKWKKTLLRAMHEHGAYIGDTGSRGYFSIEMESGNQYSSLGYDSQWNAFAANNGWPLMQPDAGYPFERYHGDMSNNADGIDWKKQVWSKLRVIDPCVSQGTC